MRFCDSSCLRCAWKSLNQGVFQVGAHGGKRLGSGRRSKEAKELGRKFFAGVVSDDDLKSIIRKHLSSSNPKISFEAATWLADHKFGKAAQRHTGDEDEPVVIRVVSDV